MVPATHLAPLLVSRTAGNTMRLHAGRLVIYRELLQDDVSKFFKDFLCRRSICCLQWSLLQCLAAKHVYPTSTYRRSGTPFIWACRSFSILYLGKRDHEKPQTSGEAPASKPWREEFRNLYALTKICYICWCTGNCSILAKIWYMG